MTGRSYAGPACLPSSTKTKAKKNFLFRKHFLIGCKKVVCKLSIVISY